MDHRSDHCFNNLTSFFSKKEEGTWLMWFCELSSRYSKITSIIIAKIFSFLVYCFKLPTVEKDFASLVSSWQEIMCVKVLCSFTRRHCISLLIGRTLKGTFHEASSPRGGVGWEREREKERFERTQCKMPLCAPTGSWAESPLFSMTNKAQLLSDCK